MNKEILHNLLADLAISYRIIANDKDKIRLSKYHQALNDFLIEYEILQSKIESLEEDVEYWKEKYKELEDSLNNDYDPEIEIPQIHGEGISW